jgi:hypothetical protein
MELRVARCSEGAGQHSRFLWTVYDWSYGLERARTMLCGDELRLLGCDWGDCGPNTREGPVVFEFGAVRQSVRNPSMNETGVPGKGPPP